MTTVKDSARPKNLSSWVPARSEALAMLEHFLLLQLDEYSDKRNYDYGPDKHVFVSRLSPFLRVKALDEPEVIDGIGVERALKYHSKFVDELCWRTYWRGYLNSRPLIWHDFMQTVDALKSQKNSENYSKAIAGETGIKCFDFWRNELRNTGYLHNHARMWFASIWIFSLKLPWQLGANIFHHELLDADPASNTFSWRWVAGLHTKGKQYHATPANIAKFTAGRFKPQDLDLASTRPIEKESIGPTEFKKAPLVSTLEISDSALIVHSDNLLYLQDLRAAREVFFISPRLTDSLCCERTLEFRDKLLTERMNHALAKGVSCQKMNCSKELEVVIRSNEKIALVQPYVGESRVFFEEIFTTQRVSPQYMQTTWDQAFFPYCTKGFFNMKKQIAGILRK